MHCALDLGSDGDVRSSSKLGVFSVRAETHKRGLSVRRLSKRGSVRESGGKKGVCAN